MLSILYLTSANYWDYSFVTVASRLAWCSIGKTLFSTGACFLVICGRERQ